VFYGSEIDTLNTAIKTKKSDRIARLGEVQAALPEKQQNPLDTFLKAVAVAVDKLCQELGLGRKYGGL